jgi:alkaline phosphatase
MKKILTNLLLIINTVVIAKPKNVILYIGDGFGIAPKTAARMAMGQGQEGKRYSSDIDFKVLALDKLSYTAMATTHSLNSWTTDSAPGASVYATGLKSDNEVVSFNIQTNKPIETILQKAKKQGYAVGLVTTTRVTHATPAAFGSNIWHRDLEEYIALQYLCASNEEYINLINQTTIDSLKYKKERDWILPYTKEGVEIDVILGGGAEYFFPKNYIDTISNTETQKGKRKDGLNLVNFAKSKGYIYVNNRESLNSLDINQFIGNKKLLGLFRSGHMSYEQDRQLNNTSEPSLAEMTEIAIKVLEKKGGKKGFFLVVEGGRIDHLGHNNVGVVTKQCTFEMDSVAYSPDGAKVRLKNTSQGDIYGSDFMIKEVLAFDYAIAEGLKFLKNKKSETLLFSTSDHECGAVALIGLYDSTLHAMRTYAHEPINTGGKVAYPNIKTRGDESTQGYFPQYIVYEFQGKKYPKPKTNQSRRIIITYASNPLSLGHNCDGDFAFGNHTPQDIWVGAEDNVGGKWAKKITGKGMLDNTDLFPIMKAFLNLK